GGSQEFSGCESGWTSYLEQSFCSYGSNDKKSGFCGEYRKGHKGKEDVVVVDDDDDDEEDLSMVSDASSGPPHFYEDDGYFNDDDHHHHTVPKVAELNKNGGKRHRNKEQQLPSLHDDTASSPRINFQKNNNFGHTNNTQASMEESGFHYHPQGFSATHFQGGPAFQGNFGFLQPSPPGNHLQGHQRF
ncbi:protein SOB FIVE-LIKE 6-like, partial [Hibiscus syriacus]|uniref:protein SOB FIVE-LIKE 6-like n=1 Tax=Hibiscus syriacus TaxID=106335 RepID=UPI0019232F37